MNKFERAIRLVQAPVTDFTIITSDPCNMCVLTECGTYRNELSPEQPKNRIYRLLQVACRSRIHYGLTPGAISYSRSAKYLPVTR